MDDEAKKQSFNKDRSRFSIESDAKKIVNEADNFLKIDSDVDGRLVVKMQSLMLDVLLDIRDELRDKSSVNKWGPKL